MSQFEPSRRSRPGILSAFPLAAAILLASGQARAEPRERHIVPIPAIPEPLRGCWVMDDPEFPDETGRLTVDAHGFTSNGRTARADYVTRIGPDSVSGLFTAPDGASRVTYATDLELSDGTRGRAGQLIVREGDSGSSLYSRCPA